MISFSDAILSMVVMMIATRYLIIILTTKLTIVVCKMNAMSILIISTLAMINFARIRHPITLIMVTIFLMTATIMTLRISIIIMLYLHPPLIFIIIRLATFGFKINLLHLLLFAAKQTLTNWRIQLKLFARYFALFIT